MPPSALASISNESPCRSESALSASRNHAPATPAASSATAAAATGAVVAEAVAAEAASTAAGGGIEAGAGQCELGACLYSQYSVPLAASKHSRSRGSGSVPPLPPLPLLTALKGSGGAPRCTHLTHHTLPLTHRPLKRTVAGSVGSSGALSRTCRQDSRPPLLLACPSCRRSPSALTKLACAVRSATGPDPGPEAGTEAGRPSRVIWKVSHAPQWAFWWAEPSYLVRG